MIPAVRVPGRRELLVGLTLGLYATAVALAPGIATKAILLTPVVAVPLAWWLLRTPLAWLAAFFGCALLLPPLPVKLGDSGPHIALLFAAAGLVIGLLRFAEWRVRVDALSISMFALLAMFAASLSLALLYSGFSIALASFARVMLVGISAYMFLYVRDGPGTLAPEANKLRWIRWLFIAGAISALFACVDFYFQFPAPAGYEQQFIWVETGVFRRAQGIFYEASTLGNLCAFFLVMIAVALFRRQRTRLLSPFVLAAGGAALATALVLSYSRGSLINLAVALAVLLWLYRDRIRWRRVAIATAAAGAVGAILVGALPVFSGAYWMRLVAAFQFFLESPNLALSGRVQSWQTLLSFLASNPWHLLLGVGYKTLPYSDFIGTRAVGDNTYLTVLAEAGILGLAAALALNAAILTHSFRAIRSGNELRSFCGTWMFCFWSGQIVQMFSADLLTYWRILPVYFFVLALTA